MSALFHSSQGDEFGCNNGSGSGMMEEHHGYIKYVEVRDNDFVAIPLFNKVLTR